MEILRINYLYDNKYSYNKSFAAKNSYNEINFKSAKNDLTTIADISSEDYNFLTETAKQRLNKQFKDFTNPVKTNRNKLIDKNYLYMPLLSDKDMNNFIKGAQIYSNYKDKNIISLGRSPKWFLNTSKSMEGGIQDYKSVAFSDYWYRIDPKEGAVRINRAAPSVEEVVAYRKYLKSIQADPKSIVDNFKNTGKKTVITDYIQTGKSACSFMEIMGDYAKDLGILKDFSKAIEIIGIGSFEYTEILDPYSETLSLPRVPMPKVLQKYDDNIKQRFYNLDYQVFCDMILNQNANNCHPDYYPHSAWTLYNPKELQVTQNGKSSKLMNKLQNLPQKCITRFLPVINNYKNMLNFRILDGLNTRKMLSKAVKTKI